jgi:hypothetical protein
MVNTVYEIGAIYGFATSAKIVSNPVREYNIIEIQVIEQKYIFTINNEKTRVHW